MAKVWKQAEFERGGVVEGDEKVVGEKMIDGKKRGEKDGVEEQRCVESSHCYSDWEVRVPSYSSLIQFPPTSMCQSATRFACRPLLP